MSIHAPTPMPVPPWMAMAQAHADRAEAVLEARAAVRLAEAPGRRRADQPATPAEVSRDITNGVVEEHLGPRPARHRKEPQL